MIIPKFQDPEVTKFFIEFARNQERMSRNKMDANTANRALLLYSPSKKVYEIKVDDAGVITATKVSG